MPLSYADARPHHGVVTTAGFFRVIGHDRTGDSQGARTGQTTLLLIDKDDPRHLTVRRNRGWARLVGRLLVSSLDRQLAEGRSPESNRLLAARAHVLVAPMTRRALVQSWEALLGQARRPPTMRTPRAPFNRETVVACEPDIQEMFDALLNPLPVPARGTAIASWLLCDGTGPIYDRHRPGDLRIALREAIEHLDPAASL